MNSKRLDPLCFKNGMGYAITNRGELVPCCRCDDTMNDNDIEFQELLRVSNISDYENIEDILKTKQWRRFYKNLRKHKGPPSCHWSCKANKDQNKIQTSQEIDTSTDQTTRFRQK